VIVHFNFCTNNNHGRRHRGAVPPWIFIHGTDIVDSCLIVLFFVFFAIFWSLFFVSFPPLGRGLIALFFGIFCYFQSLCTCDAITVKVCSGLYFDLVNKKNLILHSKQSYSSYVLMFKSVEGIALKPVGMCKTTLVGCR